MGLALLMRLVDLAHRWTGGILGILLAVLGISGALLVHKDAWLRATLPAAADTRAIGDATIAATAARLFAKEHPRSVLFAGRDLGVHRLLYRTEGKGAYADRAGKVIARWSSERERPELWLFDFHHHLLMGKVGQTIVGLAALSGIGFVMTGLLMWWRTRRTFVFRLWPKRLSRPAVLRHHRDLGVVMAPMLLMSFTTGTMMTLKPVEYAVLVAFSSPTSLMASASPPPLSTGQYAGRIDWRALVRAARTRFPTAELRMISLPTKPGAAITVRMRQPAEWLPNGRTMLWFDAADGRLLASRDALTLPLGARIANLEYPVHAAKTGGMIWKFLITLSGLTVAMLGSLAVWTFWFRRSPSRQRNKAEVLPGC